MTNTSPTFARWAKLALTGALAIYGFRILRDPASYRLLDSVDLAIHETGHLVFAPFGEFIGFAGGTIFQLIVPVTFVAYFFRQRDRFAALIVLWWVAQNLWNISVYIRDARSQALPLVGGGEHDWAYLLGATGLLASDQSIASLVHFTGVVVFGAAIIGAIKYGWWTSTDDAPDTPDDSVQSSP